MEKEERKNYKNFRNELFKNDLFVSELFDILA
jgi:hypothetical protein